MLLSNIICLFCHRTGQPRRLSLLGSIRPPVRPSVHQAAPSLGQRSIIHPSFWESIRPSVWRPSRWASGASSIRRSGSHSVSPLAQRRARRAGAIPPRRQPARKCASSRMIFLSGGPTSIIDGSVLFIRILFRNKHYVAVFSIETLRTFSLQH